MFMFAEIVEECLDDISVVNAARVSFNKKSKRLENGEISNDDARLITYLATNGHWTPFAHNMITFHIRAPIFVARQLFKHKVGLVENEVSRRYVSTSPLLFIPEEWRGVPEGNIKQGSGDRLPKDEEEHVDSIAIPAMLNALQAYDELIKNGVCPEQARMVLPQATYTEWYWTGNLAAFARICDLRLDAHAQKETREIVQIIHNSISAITKIKHSWKALTKKVKQINE